ncbi:MAG: adenosylcobinamide-GDP ribazoletransferase [Pseudooceanicola sp.]|nr:adenosylcobinamide-GDP ribazoletransferase [Pseudooceanicola sp.]
MLRRLPREALVALVLLTRLPLPALPARAFAVQARAGWAFALAGLVVGGIGCLVGLVALSAGLPGVLAAGLCLFAQVVVTGAMHEDGLADVADGFWGGFTRERRLEIMKDSRTGSYGVLALVLSVGLRWGALASLLEVAPGAVIAAACLSRGLLPGLMTALPQARPGGLSAKVGVPGWIVAAAALGLGLGLAAGFGGIGALSGLAAALVAVAALAAVARVKIGGQTGDVLGAAQQLGEIAVLLALVAFHSP